MKRLVLMVVLVGLLNPANADTLGGLKKNAYKNKAGGSVLLDDSAVRAEKNKKFLKSKGVKVLESLPLIESEKEAKLRKPADVARRVLILYNIAGIGYGMDREATIKALKKSGLWKYVTKNEKNRYLSGQLDKYAKVEAGWKIEAVWTLLWSLGVVEKLDFPVKECNLDEIGKLIPHMETADKFIKNARLRKINEILDESDLIYRIHWATRQAGIDKVKPAAGLNSDIVIERHYALNWLTCYSDSEWDDVTCDT